MLFKNVLELIKEIETVDDAGDSIKNKVYREIFGNKKSIRQNEFYQAQATGLKPEIMFEVRYDEYNDEKQLRFNGIEYNVIRTYSKDDEILELTCSKGID